jgi:LPS export ABC transporter protein LptC
VRKLLAVVIVIAFATGCDSKTQPPVAATSPLADSADQVMYGVRFKLTDAGVDRAQLHADTAYFFEDNTRIELENVNTTFFTTTGAKDAVLTSRRGTNNTRTGNMVARKNVLVVSEDGRRLTTAELIYNPQRNEISSDSAFVMTEPNRRLEGIGFRSDPNMNNIRILKGASGFAKGVTTQPIAAPGQPAPTPVPPSVVPKP